ncbi:MAG: GspJ family type II secretion system protein [Phycisphaerales bacterium]|nr:MAG: GspJ family type II secretion system protein [Phycisphaerales bacterium]
MSGGRAQPNGFTLLELLVAMTLMMVAASCLYTALYTGFKARRSATTAVEPTSLAINAIELLKQDVYGVLPPTGVLAGSFVGVDSTGIKGVDADSLEFYTTHIYSDSDNPAGGLGKIELLLEEDTDEGREGYRLVRRVITSLLAPRAVEAEEQILCRNVTSLNLRYFDGENWLDEWDSTADSNSLPRAVEIDIQISHELKGAVEDSGQRRLVQSFGIPCGVSAGQQENGGQSGQ